MRRIFIKGKMRLQSAMEYLLTYGWAILVVSVVLGALFSLGVFNPNTFSPRAHAGSCQVYRPFGPGTSVDINLQGVCTDELPLFVAHFNGNSGYVSVPSSPSLSPASFAINAWIRWDGARYSSSSAEDWAAIISKGYYDSGTYTVLLHRVAGATDTTVNLYINGQLADSWVNSVLDTNWHMLTVTYDGSTASIYLDGANESHSGFILMQASPPQQVAPGPYPLAIGSQAYGSSYFWGGEISNVQLYNATMDPETINSLYSEGIGGVPILLQNLVGWWPLNGDTMDYSGNGNTGAASNLLYTSSWTSGYSG
jgi:hypothetical protein